MPGGGAWLGAQVHLLVRLAAHRAAQRPGSHAAGALQRCAPPAPGWRPRQRRRASNPSHGSRLGSVLACPMRAVLACCGCRSISAAGTGHRVSASRLLTSATMAAAAGSAGAAPRPPPAYEASKKEFAVRPWTALGALRALASTAARSARPPPLSARSPARQAPLSAAAPPSAGAGPGRPVVLEPEEPGHQVPAAEGGKQAAVGSAPAAAAAASAAR